MSDTPTFATEAAAASDRFSGGRFADKERQVLKSVENHLSDTTSVLNIHGVECRQVSGTITNAQLKVLNATPVVLIAAPESDQIIRVTRVQLKYVYATAAFDNTGASGDLELQYGVTAYNALSVGVSGFLNQTNNEWRFIDQGSNPPALAGQFITDRATGENLQLTTASGELYTAAGGGTMLYKIDYEIIDVLN